MTTSNQGNNHGIFGLLKCPFTPTQKQGFSSGCKAIRQAKKHSCSVLTPESHCSLTMRYEIL